MKKMFRRNNVLKIGMQRLLLIEKYFFSSTMFFLFEICKILDYMCMSKYILYVYILKSKGL